MAVIAGFLSQKALGGIVNQYLADEMLGFDLPIWPPHDSEITPSFLQIINQNLPVSATPIELSGAKSIMYVDDYYYRIHVIPPLVELGNIVGSREVSVNLWNSYLTEKSATDLTATGNDGIDILSGEIPPYVMAPLEIKNYSFNVTADGGAIINAIYTWTIDTEQYNFNIRGQRFVVFPFTPNFENTGPIESLEWKTQVIRKSTGQEQRRSLRIKPRRNFRFNFNIMSVNEQQHLRALMWGWLNRSFAIPVWVDETELTSQVNAGSITIPVTSTAYRSFAIGTSAIIYRDIQDYEVIEIQGLTGNSIIAKIATVRTWPKDSKIYPVVLGHMPAAVGVQRLTNNIFTGEATFQTSPDITQTGLTSSAAPVIYDGIEVLTYQPNWEGNIDDSFEFPFDTVDGDTGPIAWFVTENYSRTARRYKWLIKGRQQIAEFKSFLERMRGQLSLCWVPTWADDLTVLESIPAVSDQLIVVDNAFRRLVGADTAHDRIMIKLKSGQIFYRRIVAVGEQAGTGNTQIAISSPLGLLVNPSDIETIHFMDRGRFMTDKIDITWQTNDVITVESTFISVPV